jgi:hypothetical protein
MRMKKHLLIAMTACTITALSQVVYSPFWPTQNSNFADTAWGIRAMDAVDANVVWAIGKNGWAPKNNCVEFTRTINGGALYTSGYIFPDTNTYYPCSIEGIDGNTAWVTSILNGTLNKGAIHITTNGGASWTNMTAANMFTSTVAFADFTCFLSPTIGITVGDPVGGEFEIHRTTNGGTTWSQISGTSIPNPLSGEYGCWDVYEKFGSNNIWFGTNKGRVFYSTDGGQTWSASSSIGTNWQVTRLAFRDANNGLMLAYNTGTIGLCKTSNGGATWSIVPVTPNLGQAGICAIPGTTWYASCGYTNPSHLISYSTDDGTSWNTWGGSKVQYLDIDFVSNTVGFAGGFSGSPSTVNGMFKYTGAPLNTDNLEISELNVNIYPNPSTGIITVNLPTGKHGSSIFIIDVMGKTVYSENIKNLNFQKHNLNLEHLGQGIYSINVISDEQLSTQKIIIQ